MTGEFQGVVRRESPGAVLMNSAKQQQRTAANGHAKHQANGADVELPAGGLALKRVVAKEWKVKSNPFLTKCGNPIRKILDALGKRESNGKEVISLAQGDPVSFGPHMQVPEEACSALVNVIQAGNSNGYSLSVGNADTRRALADYLSGDGPYQLSAQDVALCGGAGQAIHVTIDAFRFPGCNILLPRPGFALYEAICRYFSVEPRFYDLLEDRNWEVDLLQVSTLVDDDTAAILVCNPGNPSGSVFGHQHLAQIANLAGELKVTIIADEVYDKTVFGKAKFVSLGTFSSCAPVVTIGSISKSWLATGWRLGWLALWDPQDVLKNAKIPEAILSILQITSGPSTPMQAALPELLRSTPASVFEKTREHLRAGADICYSRATKIPGLSVPTRPEGSMFMMVKLDLVMFEDITSDTEFSQALLREESVLVLPGIAFGIPSWFRIVFALSLPQLGLAWDRIEEFCSRHVRQL